MVLILFTNGVINEVLKGEKPDLEKLIYKQFFFFEVEPGYGSSIIDTLKAYNSKDVMHDSEKDMQRHRPNRRRQIKTWKP